MNTKELECGVVLELQAVRPMLLLDLLEGMKKGRDGKYSASSLTGLSIQSLNRLMRFLCGWGVTNEVPEDQLDSVSIFGDGEHLQRSAWVRMIATENELTDVFAQVMALTQIKMQQPAQPTPEQTELEALREKVAELENKKVEDGSD